MVNKNISDDLLIHGKPDSLKGKIKTVPEKTLELVGDSSIDGGLTVKSGIGSTSSGDLDLKGTVKIINDGADTGKLRINGTDSTGDVLQVNGVDIQDYVHSFNVRSITSTPATLTNTNKIIDVYVTGAAAKDRIWNINFPAATTNKWFKIHVHGTIGKDIVKGGVVWMHPSASTEWMDGKRESDGDRKALPIQQEGTYVFRAVINYRGSGSNGWVIDHSHPKTFIESPFFTTHVASTANLADLTSDLDAGNVIDGVTLVEGMNVLLKDQTTATENGAYMVPEALLGVTADRVHHTSVGDNAGSQHFHVNAGTFNGGKTFRVSNVYGSDVVGTDNLTFKEFGGIIPSVFNWKQVVRVATTGALTLASDFENADTVDGVALATGDRILIKDQAAGAENGIYTVNASGAPSRATDMPSGSFGANVVCFVSEGTANGDESWLCTNDGGSDVVGTDALVFTQFGALTTPGGANTNIQFNNSGVFGGSANLTWDGSALNVQDISSIDATSAATLFNNNTSGQVCIGASLTTGNIVLGNESSGILVIDQVKTTFGAPPQLEAVTVTDAVKLFDTTTTGNITLGEVLTTGDISLGRNGQTGSIRVKANNNSTNTSTGGLIVSGGIGCQRDIWCGSNVNTSITETGILVEDVGGLSPEPFKYINTFAATKFYVDSSGNVSSDAYKGLSSSSNLTYGGNITTGNITLGGALTTGDVVIGKSGQTGKINIINTTDSSSSTTGALVVDGGLGIAKKTYLGDDLVFTGTSTVSTSTGNLTLTSAGGLNFNSATTLNITAGVGSTNSIFHTTTTGIINIGQSLTSGNINLGVSTQTGIIDVKSELRLSNKGSVTQITSATTPVTLSKPIGKITTVSQTLASHATVTFTVTNTYSDATSVIMASIQEYGGSGAINVTVDNIASGSFDLIVSNSSGTTLDAIAIVGFVIL